MSFESPEKMVIEENEQANQVERLGCTGNGICSKSKQICKMQTFFEHSLPRTSNRDTVIPIKVIAHFHKINTAP